MNLQVQLIYKVKLILEHLFIYMVNRVSRDKDKLMDRVLLMWKVKLKEKMIKIMYKERVMQKMIKVFENSK